VAGTHVSKLYSVEDGKIAALTADPSGGSATYGSLIDVPGIKTVGIKPEISNVSLTGDNVELESDSALKAIVMTVANAKMSLDALGVMLGGTTTDSGTGAAEIARYRRIGTDAFSYFKFEAKTPTNGTDNIGGDVHLVVYKAKLTDIDFGFAEQDYAIVSWTARGVFRTADAFLFDLVFNETAAAIA
jgi:hypothetical protein